MEHSRLAKLPQELRDHIYDLVLHFVDNTVHLEDRQFGGFGATPNPSRPKNVRVNILLTCKQMSSEVAKRLYATNIFSITQHAMDSPCEDMMEIFLASIGHSNATAIKEMRFMYTMSQGTFGNGQFRRALRRVHRVAQMVTGATCKVFLTFLDVYKSIAIKVKLDLKDGLLLPDDGWIEEFEPITSASTVDSTDLQESMGFLKNHLRECKRDIGSI